MSQEKYYSSLEKQQIKFLQDKYKEIFGIDDDHLPSRLKVVDVKPLPLVDWHRTKAQVPVSAVDFEASSWLSKLGKQPLRLYAENIIQIICQYQKQRADRYFGNGHLGDPTNLFFEHLKEWARDTISHNPGDENLLKTINNYIKYLRAIERSDLFEPGSFSKLTTVYTSIRLREELTETKKYIELQLINKTAQEEINQLVNNIKATVKHGVEFLYYIYNDNPEFINDCTIEHLRKPSTQSLKDYAKSKAGKLLCELVNTNELIHLFPDRSTTLNPVGTQVDLQLQNKFLTITSSVQHLQVIDAIKQQLVVPTTGITRIYQEFLNKPDLIDNYLKLHGLLQQLARLALTCERFKYLAGEGGSLFIYGVPKITQAIRNLMQSFMYLSDAIISNLHILNTAAEQQYNYLFQERIKHTWIKNYQQAVVVFDVLYADLEESKKIASNIHSKACTGIPPERLNQFAQQMVSAVQDANSLSIEILTWFNPLSLTLEQSNQPVQLLDSVTPISQTVIHNANLQPSLDNERQIQQRQLAPASINNSTVLFQQPQRQDWGKLLENAITQSNIEQTQKLIAAAKADTFPVNAQERAKLNELFERAMELRWQLSSHYLIQAFADSELKTAYNRCWLKLLLIDPVFAEEYGSANPHEYTTSGLKAFYGETNEQEIIQHIERFLNDTISSLISEKPSFNETAFNLVDNYLKTSSMKANQELQNTFNQIIELRVQYKKKQLSIRQLIIDINTANYAEAYRALQNLLEPLTHAEFSLSNINKEMAIFLEESRNCKEESITNFFDYLNTQSTFRIPITVPTKTLLNQHLLVSAELGSALAVKLLLYLGASWAYEPDKLEKKFTALHIAAVEGHLLCLKILVEHSEAVNCPCGKDASTPLHSAAVAGKLEIVKYLISQGARINATNLKQWAPLHVSINSGHQDVVAELLRQGAEPNLANDAQDVPLVIAIKRNRADIAQLLLQNGADVNTQNSHGETPLEIAKRLRKQPLIELLENHTKMQRENYSN